MRDMTKKQFEAALAKNDFQQHPATIFWFVSAVDRQGPLFGAVVDSETKKILRRETLAKLIKERRIRGVIWRTAR